MAADLWGEKDDDDPWAEALDDLESDLEEDGWVGGVGGGTRDLWDDVEEDDVEEDDVDEADEADTDDPFPGE